MQYIYQIYCRMARQAQTAAAVLGALSIEPMTGYEIRQAITSVLGHFWHESFGQIYPCLADARGAGTGRVAPRAPAPARPPYSLTDAGRARLRDLLAEPPVPQPPAQRRPPAGLLRRSPAPGDLARCWTSSRRLPRRGWPRYAGIRAGIASEQSHAEHHPYWLATVRAGELSAEAHAAVAGRDAGGAPPTCYPFRIMTTALLLRCRDEA